MIPSPHELATLAIRRRAELTDSFEALAGKSGTSLLPAVLQRCIVTSVLCHQTLGVLDRAVSVTMREVSHRQGNSVEPEPPTQAELRYARLWHNHLSLAVNQALITYGEVLRAQDWRVQRQALDSLLELLTSIEFVGGLTEQPMALEPLIEGAMRIRALLEARRPEMGIAGALFRDQESFNVEGTAWCYCAMLVAETLRTRADGSVLVKGAVRMVDAMRADVEKSISLASRPVPSVVNPPARPPEVVKSQG